MRRHAKAIVAISALLLLTLALGAMPATAAAPVASIDAPSAITASSAHLSGKVDPEDQETSYRFEYSADSGANWNTVSFQGPLAAGSGETPVADDLTGLKPGTEYTVRLLAESADGQTLSAEPNPSFTTDAVAPQIVSIGAIGTYTEATLSAQVNPGGLATTYHFEYGSTGVYGRSTPAKTIPVGADPVLVTANIAGLAPASGYHFKLVTSNTKGIYESGDQTFSTQSKAAAGNCPNEALRLQQGSTFLPSCRAYELVSPADKNGNGAAVGSSANFASIDGRHFVWSSFQPLLDGNDGSTNQYEATRGAAGWSSRAMTVPQTEYHVVSPFSFAFYEFACDTCSSLVGISPNSADPGDHDPTPFGFVPGLDVYVSDGVGSQTWVSRGSIGGTAPIDAIYGGRSADGSHIAFTSSEALEPAAEAVEPGASIAYQRIGGRTMIVGRADDGSVLAGGSMVGGTGQQAAVIHNAVSADGLRIFFVSPGASAGPLHLFMRVNDEHTVEISAPQCERAGCGSGAIHSFQGASRDGSIVFFTSEDQLVDGDTDARLDIYAYNVDSGELTRISGGESGAASSSELGFSGNSEDGSHVYFWTTAALTSTPNARDEVPVEGKYNLYVYNTQTRSTIFIGAVTYLDRTKLYNTEGAPNDFTLTPNGNVAAFVAEAPLRGSTNGARQVYRYDASNDALSCVSCQGSQQQGSASLWGSPQTRYTSGTPRRHLSADGSRLFFVSTSSLAPRDTNGLLDVYEWHDGNISLLSAGTGRFESVLFDTSADGRDVFIATSDQLVRADPDRLIDVYDVRVGGGIDEAAASACAGDGCQTPAAPPPDAGAPASEALAGKANAKPRKKQTKKRHAKKNRRRQAKRHGKSAAKKQKTKAHRAGKDS